MSTSGQSFQSRGFETSLDVARRQAYLTAPIAGQKRSSSEQAAEHSKVSKEVVWTVSHRSNHDADILESIPLESARAALELPPSRFTASRIIPAPDATASESDPEKGTSVAPGSSQNPLLWLSNPKYGLPDTLTANFSALGVNAIYPWQASCLLARGLLSGEQHLVYTAPTGGGKSLVADVLLLKRIIENPTRKAILVLPYVALVQEKLKWMCRIVQGVEKLVPDDEQAQSDRLFPRTRRKRMHKDIRVTGYFGGSRTTTSWADTDIAVCTLEKVGFKVFCFINAPSDELVIGQFPNQHCDRRMQHWRPWCRGS